MDPGHQLSAVTTARAGPRWCTAQRGTSAGRRRPVTAAAVPSGTIEGCAASGMGRDWSWIGRNWWEFTRLRWLLMRHQMRCHPSHLTPEGSLHKRSRTGRVQTKRAASP